MLILPLAPARAEIVVVNSRFIASLEPASSVEEARAFIARVKAEFPDATHNVGAFVVGGGSTTTDFCSDDGEPSGTAGRPLLAVIKGSGMGDIAAVVTRYFGGTLLGTGGLVKAYTEAGKAVLALVKRAALVESARLEVDLPYPLFDRFRTAAAEAGALLLEESFDEAVHVAVEIPVSDLEAFRSRIVELSSGAVVPRLVSTRMARHPLE